MKAEYFITNKDECVAIVYFHKTLGRMVVFRGEIDIEYPIFIHPLEASGEIKETDLMEFIMKAIPYEEK